MLKYHAAVLTGCSFVAFAGHYLQFGLLRLTALIPAIVALFVLVLIALVKHKKGNWKQLPLLVVAVFGMLTTIMCIRFLSQEFQPLRKKIIFTIMSVSAWATIIYALRVMWKKMKEDWRKRTGQ
jgi:hypothetical protein